MFREKEKNPSVTKYDKISEKYLHESVVSLDLVTIAAIFT